MSILDKNRVYETDCLIMLERLEDDSIDLVYIDPPWYVGPPESKNIDEYQRFMRKVIRQFKRVLSPTGNVFIHVAPETGVYIRPLMTEAFGDQNYVPEISIPRPHLTHNRSREKSHAAHEIILHYSKSQDYTYNRLYVSSDEIKAQQQKISQKEVTNRSFDTMIDVTDVWTDLSLLVPYQERFDYPGQKPLAITDRLVQIGSNPGDVVLDTFCGTGTTFVSAHRFNRRWIGCDNSRESISIVQQRLQKVCGLECDRDYQIQNEQYLKDQFELVRSSAFSRFFISYRRLDKDEFVHPFIQRLRSEGLDYWLDERDIPPGEEWQPELDKALKNTDAMIIFVTPEALRSPHVQREYETYLKARKKIFPVLCREVSMDYPLGHIQHTSYTDTDKLIRELLKFKPDYRINT